MGLQREDVRKQAASHGMSQRSLIKWMEEWDEAVVRLKGSRYNLSGCRIVVKYGEGSPWKS